MEDSAYYIGEVITCLVFLIAGARLLRRSLRTHATPERLLGMSFLLWSVRYPIYDIPYVLGVSDAVLAPFAYASRIFWHLGTVALALFVRNAFRNANRGASWFVAGVIALLVAGGVGSAVVGDWAGDYPLSNPWWWLERTGSVAPLVWIGAEGFSHYVKARQRRWLGEGDPLLGNRIRLWGLAGSFWVMVELVSATQYLLYEASAIWPASLSTLLAILEVVSVGMVWLVFFPPVAYQRWINRRTTSHARIA